MKCLCRCQSTEVDGPKTKRNLLDNASNLLTNLLSGGNLGTMPIAEGAVSDLFGRPLFFALYDWFLEVFTSFVNFSSASSTEILVPWGHLLPYTPYNVNAIVYVLRFFLFFLVSWCAKSFFRNFCAPFHFVCSWDLNIHFFLFFCFFFFSSSCFSMDLFINLPLDQKPLLLYQILLWQDIFFVKTHLVMTR